MEYQTYSPQQLKIKRRLVVIAITGLLGFVFWLLYNYGFVEVAINGRVSGSASYFIASQKTNKSTFSGESSKPVKKFVRRGNYEVSINHETGSYLAVVRTGGFLTTKRLDANLKPERSREFIANNPAPCIGYSGNILVSSGCLGRLDSVSIHIPSKTEQPTYIKKLKTGINGLVEGFLSFNQEIYILVKSVPGNEDQAAPHMIYRVTDSGDLADGLEVPKLAEDRTYSIQSYRSGFLISDTLYRDAYYFEKPGGDLTEFKLAPPSNNGYVAYALSATDNSLLVAYTDAVSESVLEIHDTEEDKAKTEIMIQTNNQTKRYNFKGSFGSIQLCGNQKICMIDINNMLRVYDVSGKKAKLLFELGGIKSAKSLSGTLIIVRSDAVVALDVDTREGYTQYSFGGYRYCGLELLGNKYIICAASDKARHALLISPDVGDSTKIDKKVLELQRLSEIKSLSVYQQFIHISPEFGQKQYMPEVGGFGFPDSVKKQVNEKINLEVKRLGIDQGSFKVINLFE
jgi:hypothetical protein